MIRVVLSEAHPLLRQGLLAVLEGVADIRVVAVAGTGSETLVQEDRCVPELHLISVCLPPTSGYDVARQLSRRRPTAGIILLASGQPTDQERTGAASYALVVGARGYLAGDADATELLCAVRTVAAGVPYLSGPSLLEVVAAVRRLAVHHRDLTPEQRTTLDLVRRGLTNKEIAAARGVSLSTVKRRIHELEVVFGVHGRTRIAVRGFTPDQMPPLPMDGTAHPIM